MSFKLDDYAAIVGKDVVDEIRAVARMIQGRRVCHVNSTAVGGGVAEILNRMVPLMREVGIEASWEVIKGGEEFYAVTKSMHNALQGAGGTFTREMAATFEDIQEENRRRVPTSGADVMIIHDPQPAGLLTPATRGSAKWVWRCHIDLSRPNESYWAFLRGLVAPYDASIFSSPKFAQYTGNRAFVIPPSIDPLSEKNRDLPPEVIRSTLEKYSLDPKRPIVTQVSRFDLFKDPVGVIEAYRVVKKAFDVQLVLAGGSADDDPEGAAVLAKVKEAASHDADIHILNLPPTAHTDINAIQRGSTIILQKSTKEGFGLTVTEGLWKGKPVIGGAVGGITLQVKHKMTGILVNSVDGAAYYIRYLLANPDFAAQLGKNGKEHVRQNFLLTRHLRDYMLLMVLVMSGRQGLVRESDLQLA